MSRRSTPRARTLPARALGAVLLVLATFLGNAVRGPVVPDLVARVASVVAARGPTVDEPVARAERPAAVRRALEARPARSDAAAPSTDVLAAWSWPGAATVAAAPWRAPAPPPRGTDRPAEPKTHADLMVLLN